MGREGSKPTRGAVDSGSMKAINVESYSRLVVLTGAGISVASGLRPYRGPGGIWNEIDVMQVASATAMRARPEEVWRFFAEARRAISQAQPNPAHLALTRLQERLGTDRMKVVTQNIDGLHQRAGTREVVELHGTLARSRCSDEACQLPAFDDLTGTEACPPCPRCGRPLRADVVLFEEPIPVDAEWQVKRALHGCDLFVAIGTSGTVWPASSFVRSAAYEGARTVLINLEPMQPRDPAFAEEYLGPAEELVPELLGV